MTFAVLLAELKRRKVFRVAAVYGATSFVLLQLADILFPPLGFPQWTITLVGVLALIGFPMARDLALFFLGIEDHENAIKYLERAFTEGDPMLVMISTAKAYDPLRKDPRFIRLTQQLGIPNGI